MYGILTVDNNAELYSWKFLQEKKYSVQFNSVQSLSRVWLFVTPWIAARQASLSITDSRSLCLQYIHTHTMVTKLRDVLI